MDPNPNSFPILSYVLSRLQSLNLSSPSSGAGSGAGGRLSDVEMVAERLPDLKSPALLASMAAAVSNVAQTRAILETIGDRPDHEAVDLARRRLEASDADLARRLEEIVLAPRPAGVDRLAWRAELAAREAACRAEAERERAALRAVVQLDGMHEAYENLLRDAEKKLARMYEGSALAEDGGDGKGEEVSEEVVGILQQGFGDCVERLDLSARQLRALPEAFGRLRGLVALNLSNNQLEVVSCLLFVKNLVYCLHLSSVVIQFVENDYGLI